MKKRFKPHLFIAILLLSISAHQLSFAQVGSFVSKDYRIAKHQEAMLSFLNSKAQFSSVIKNVKLDNFKDRMIIRSCLALFDDMGNDRLLLVKFSTTADHSTIFWAVLTESKYFFFDSIKSPNFLSLYKVYDKSTVNLIKKYCQEYNY